MRRPLGKIGGAFRRNSDAVAVGGSLYERRAGTGPCAGSNNCARARPGANHSTGPSPGSYVGSGPGARSDDCARARPGHRSGASRSAHGRVREPDLLERPRRELRHSRRTSESRKPRNRVHQPEPGTVNQVIQFSITAEVLSGLVQLDPELKPSPDLAESWSVSDDLLTYTFNLRENAQFHTGRQFTADDVVYTYDHQLDPATQSIHTKGLEGVNRPEKIDDFTVEISTAFPRASS